MVSKAAISRVEIRPARSKRRRSRTQRRVRRLRTLPARRLLRVPDVQDPDPAMLARDAQIQLNDLRDQFQDNPDALQELNDLSRDIQRMQTGQTASPELEQRISREILPKLEALEVAPAAADRRVGNRTSPQRRHRSRGSRLYGRRGGVLPQAQQGTLGRSSLTRRLVATLVILVLLKMVSVMPFAQRCPLAARTRCQRVILRLSCERPKQQHLPPVVSLEPFCHPAILDRFHR